MSGIIGKSKARGSGTISTDGLVTSVSGSTGVVADSDIDHDSLANFAANEHFTQANITALGTVTSGTLDAGTALSDVTMSLGSDVDGDMYYRTSNILTRLPRGSDNHVMTMNGTTPNWEAAAAAGGGKVLQIQTTTITGIATYSGQSFGTDYITVAITPAHASNKIWITLKLQYGGGGAGYEDICFRLHKNTSVVTDSLGSDSSISDRTRATFSGTNRSTYECSYGIVNYVDTAGMTSAITYSIVSNSGLHVNRTATDADLDGVERPSSTMTAIEFDAT